MTKSVKVKIYLGDNRQTIKKFADDSVHCIVTSPPYWNLRDYGGEVKQIGQEKTLEEYISSLVKLFRQCRKKLRADGTFWLNIGDTYAGKPTLKNVATVGAYKNKDMLGMPWRLAFALMDDGWYLRFDAIWAKTNGLPDGAKDRPSRNHEYVFLFSKSENYFYDVESAKTPSLTAKNLVSNKTDTNSNVVPLVRQRGVWLINTQASRQVHTAVFPEKLVEECLKPSLSAHGVCAACGTPWERVEASREIVSNSALNRKFGGTDKGKYSGKSTKDYEGTKAQIPSRTKQRILDAMNTRITWTWKANCKCDKPVVPSIVLDPFGGSGTTGLVAAKMQNNAILLELNKDYGRVAKKRIKAALPQDNLHTDYSVKIIKNAS